MTTQLRFEDTNQVSIKFCSETQSLQTRDIIMGSHDSSLGFVHGKKYCDSQRSLEMCARHGGVNFESSSVRG